jgi:hypothetical protein
MSTYFWKVYERPGRRVWYDRRQRLWTMLKLDANGDQQGDADYTSNRELAFRWLAGEDFPRTKQTKGETV